MQHQRVRHALHGRSDNAVLVRGAPRGRSRETFAHASAVWHRTPDHGPHQPYQQRSLAPQRRPFPATTARECRSQRMMDTRRHVGDERPHAEQGRAPRTSTAPVCAWGLTEEQATATPGTVGTLSGVGRVWLGVPADWRRDGRLRRAPAARTRPAGEAAVPHPARGPCLSRSRTLLPPAAHSSTQPRSESRTGRVARP